MALQELRSVFCLVVLAATTVAENRTSGQTISELIDQATAAAELGENARAIELAARAIERDPKQAAPYKTRARELFRAGRITDSIRDFDKYIELEPQFAPRQWERGIALFYGAQYDKGAEQFERYQTFDGHDVENSVWRFLCMAPKTGVGKAQAVMLPIDNDRRIPMMKIYDLFRGKIGENEVLAAATADNPKEPERAGRLFYTHLYLGLWFDANGEKDKAKQYIDLAADDKLSNNPRINRYMWDVARIHQKLLRGELEKPLSSPQKQ